MPLLNDLCDAFLSFNWHGGYAADKEINLALLISLHAHPAAPAP